MGKDGQSAFVTFGILRSITDYLAALLIVALVMFPLRLVLRNLGDKKAAEEPIHWWRFSCRTVMWSSWWAFTYIFISATFFSYGKGTWLQVFSDGIISPPAIAMLGGDEYLDWAMKGRRMGSILSHSIVMLGLFLLSRKLGKGTITPPKAVTTG